MEAVTGEKGCIGVQGGNKVDDDGQTDSCRVKKSFCSLTGR